MRDQRSVVLIPYFYTRDWWEHNVDTPEAYTKWRNTWGDYYLDIQDARDLYYLLVSMGGQIRDTPGFKGDLSAALGSIKAKTLFIVSPQDLFYPPPNIEADLKAIPNSRATWIDSEAGHLICCNADPDATRVMGVAIKVFLREISSERNSGK